MKTNQNFTHEILGGYLMSNNKLNTEYLSEQVYIVAINTRYIYDKVRNNRIKPLSIAKCAICEFVNTELTYNGYNTVCTYKQITNFKRDIEKVIEILENMFKDERIELCA